MHQLLFCQLTRFVACLFLENKKVAKAIKHIHINAAAMRRHEQMKISDVDTIGQKLKLVSQIHMSIF